MLAQLRRFASCASLMGWSVPAAAMPQVAANGGAPSQAGAVATVKPDSQKEASTGAPVVVRGDTVLIIRTRSGAFTASDRAEAIVRRIESLARSRVDSIVAVVGETSTDLLAGETVVMVVTDADAAAAGVSRSELAVSFAGALLAELQKVSLKATIRTVSLGALWTLLATTVLVLLLFLLGRAFPKLTGWIESLRASRMPALRLRTLELLSADHFTDALLGATRLLRVLVVVVLLYFYLPLVLSFFPWTQRLSVSLLGYVTTPLFEVGRSMVRFLPNIFFIAVILLVVRYILRAVHLVFAAIGRGTLGFDGFESGWAEPTYKIVRFMIIAFALVALFPYLPGAKSDAFKGVSLFLGVLFSLGSSTAVSNVVAGLVLTYTRAFEIGDRVRIGDSVGDVVTKTTLVTRIRTIKNEDITIPNAMVLGTRIVNYTAMAKSDGLILHTTITIGYDAPWKTVHALMIAAAKDTPGILATPEPFVLQTSLDDFYVSYQINAYTDMPSSMARTYSLLHANMQDKFNEGGVEIMSPHYATLRDGNRTTIPASYVASDYMPPPFLVKATDA